jgi:membrane-associated phospholipid phosphatase
VTATSLLALAVITAQHYKFTPVEDGAVLSLSAGLGLLSQAIVSTGEIRPQEAVDAHLLLSIDRPFALNPTPESSGRLLSNLAIGAAIAGVAVDSALCFWLDRGDSAWTYAGLYAQTIAINIAVANVTKMAVRRPRPRAYAMREGNTPAPTDDALSFYSLHTALTAGLTATAAHFAFTRWDEGAIPWIIVGTGVLVTTFVGWQRVRARAHFPTDVIAGAMIGAGIGVLVPATHRTVPEVPIALSLSAGGSGLALSGVF